MRAASLSDLTSLGVLGLSQDLQDATPAVDDAPSVAGAVSLNVGSSDAEKICFHSFPSKQTGQVAHYQPSFILKAYAYALKSHLSIDNDLSAASLAIFVASPLQRGIPIGVKEPFINQQVYSKSNCLQTDDSPIFRLGNSDFFEWLHEYTDHVRDSSKTDEVKLKTAKKRHQKAQRNASIQLELATFRFQNVAYGDPTMTFAKWLEDFGYDYRYACEDRDEAAKRLKEVANNSMSDVKRTRGLLDSAQEQHASHPGGLNHGACSRSNMPCAIQDNDENSGINAPKETPTDIIYRPRHFLPGFQDCANTWKEKASKSPNDKDELKINLTDCINVSWRELGFPQFDKDDQAPPPATALEGWDVRLRFTAMQPFDVVRGLWNTDGFRTLLPPLASTAPAYLHKKVYKTVRLLLAYNFELTAKLPDSVVKDIDKGASPASADAGQLRLLPELMSGLPFTIEAGNMLYARTEHDNIYPVLLGVLAQHC